MHGACSADAIWIEEFSQIEAALWAQFNKPEGLQWILTGDCNQFPPFFDSWHGAAVHENAFRDSSFFRTLAGGNRLVLVQGFRADMELFNFYSSLIRGGERFLEPLSQTLEAARALCSFEGPARNNLVISHRRRVMLNRQLNKIFVPPGVTPTFIRCKPKPGQTCIAQNMFIWPGIQLLGCVQATKRGVKNNVLYEVLAIGEDTVTLAPTESEGGTLELSLSQLSEFCRLSFCRTYASCQGWECEDSLRLHDTGNPHFSRRHLFVAMSRGKECAMLAIA